MTDPLKPNPVILVRLGSLMVHVEEMLSDKGHTFDLESIKALLADPELKEWLKQMDEMALLPVKR